jgi:hypothetical protein
VSATIANGVDAGGAEGSEAGRLARVDSRSDLEPIARGGGASRVAVCPRPRRRLRPQSVNNDESQDPNPTRVDLPPRPLSGCPRGVDSTTPRLARASPSQRHGALRRAARAPPRLLGGARPAPSPLARRSRTGAGARRRSRASSSRRVTAAAAGAESL